LKEQIVKIFSEFADHKIVKIEEIPESASARKYFRIHTNENSYIFCKNDNLEENAAFFHFTENFNRKGIPVPKLIFIDSMKKNYILSDLGNVRLNDFLEKKQFDERTMKILYQILDELLNLQFSGLDNLNLELAYPRKEFDIQSIMWDLNYFKYYFLKLFEIDFNENRLERDFKNFTEYLLQANSNYFLFRDFQSRNIMILNEKPHFIDYQGGRKGALQYDLASFLFDGVANFSVEIRQNLLQYYIKKLREKSENEANLFMRYFYHFAIVRLFQALGAFGFRGIIQKKQQFIDSIPNAVKKLFEAFEPISLEFQFEEIENILVQIKRKFNQ
jgi:aminoglycoside/choline kinase family phosphotransferase